MNEEDMEKEEEKLPGKPEDEPKKELVAPGLKAEAPKDPEETPFKPEERVYPRANRKQEKKYHLAHQVWDRLNSKLAAMRNRYEQFVISLAELHELVARGPYCIFEKHLMTVADMQRVRRGILKLDEVEKKVELLSTEIAQDDLRQNEMYGQQLAVNGKFLELAEIKAEIAESWNYAGPTLWDLDEFGAITPRPLGKIMKTQYVQMELEARAAEEQAEKDEEEVAARP